MKVILIDDEPNSSRNLERKLMMVYPEIDVVSSCTNVQESVEAIKAYRPDLIFLDMELGAEDGFEVLQKTKDISFETIVVTVYPEYAKEAFKYNVAHFLTKPVQKEELAEAIQRISIDQASSIGIENQLKQLRNKVESINRIGIRLSDEPEIIFLSTHQINYCESNGNKTKIHLCNGEVYLANGTLGNFGKILETSHFIRVHHQYLINLLHLERYNRATSNVTVNGERRPLNVSNNYKGRLLIKLREITISAK